MRSSWSISAQRPARRATDRNETEVKARLGCNYPATARRVRVPPPKFAQTSQFARKHISAT